MKKKSLIIAAIIALQVFNLVIAQDFDYPQEESLKMKYWAYRYRFLGDDFIPSPCPLRSLGTTAECEQRVNNYLSFMSVKALHNFPEQLYFYKTNKLLAEQKLIVQ